MNKFNKNGVNIETYKLLFDNIDIPVLEFGKISDLKIIKALELFTTFGNNKLFNLFRKIYYSDVIDFSKIVFDKDNNLYRYTDDNLNFYFDLISRNIDDDKLKIILTSGERYDMSDLMCIQLASEVSESYIVTGFITIGNVKKIHSIIQYKNNGNQDMTIDLARNIIIDTDSYYSLTNFQPISITDSSKIPDDIKLIDENINISIKEYTAFRDELIKDIEKNKKMFKVKKL